MDQRVQIVTSVMWENLHRKLLRDRLAKIVHLSPSRLRHLFKAETGMTLANYLLHLRMQRAKSLLETTPLSIKQIMASVGIYNKSHFTAEFKKLHGQTPSEYRRARARSQPPESFVAGQFPSSHMQMH